MGAEEEEMEGRTNQSNQGPSTADACLTLTPLKCAQIRG